MKSGRTNFLAALCLASGVLAAPTLATAAAAVTTDVPPPTPRTERAPPPRDGYVWAPGYWDWNGHWYTWISGTIIPQRRGLHWVPALWEPIGANWRLVRGHWES